MRDRKTGNKLDPAMRGVIEGPDPFVSDLVFTVDLFHDEFGVGEDLKLFAA
jgi:hypothetical protein